MEFDIKGGMRIGGLWASVVLCGLALLCWTGRGRADEVAAAPAEVAEAPGDLEQPLRQGIEAYDRGDLATARRAFERVHAQSPTARTLRSLGLVAFREGRFEDALALLEASLASQVKPLTDAQREGAVAVLAEVRAKLPKSAEAIVAPPPVPSAPAPAEIAASPVQPSGPRVPDRAAAPVAKPARERDHGARSVRLKRAGYALLGLAGAALIASVTSYQVGRARLGKIEDDCRGADGCELDDVLERERKAKLDALGTASLVTGIAAGAAGASGTALLLWRWRSDQNSAARAELGLGWQGVF